MSTKTRNALSRTLRALGACDEAVKWSRGYADLQSAWDACPRAEWMLWLCAEVEYEHPAFETLAYSFVNDALRDASKALRASADTHPDATRAETLRHQAASDAAWAASDAAQANRIREHIPDVAGLLDAISKRAGKES